MPRRGSRRSTSDSQDDDELEYDENPPSQRRRTVLSQQRQQQASQDDEEEEDDAMMFSSQMPEFSQEILPVRETERSNLMHLDAATREKAIRDLTRLVLFKGLAGEPIDRNKCLKEVESVQGKRVSTALFDQANERLKNVFDFELKRMPVWMEQIKQGFPKSFKDRYYLINSAIDDDSDSYNKALLAVHDDCAIERGFLMTVLALCYCQGEPRHDGSRWITQQDLYTLLHRLDENIPSEAPSKTKKRSSQQSQSQRMSLGRGGDVGGVGMTPDVDVLLHKLVQRDYLVMYKQSQPGDTSHDEPVVYYTMGPRAGMEIGRRQVIYFCSEILEQDPDPTMLELEQHGDASQEEMEA